MLGSRTIQKGDVCVNNLPEGGVMRIIKLTAAASALFGAGLFTTPVSAGAEDVTALRSNISTAASAPIILGEGQLDAVRGGIHVIFFDSAYNIAIFAPDVQRDILVRVGGVDYVVEPSGIEIN
jgi:hypothetical protein